MKRRNFLELGTLSMLSIPITNFKKMDSVRQNVFVYVSSWTKNSPNGGGQGGIHVFRLNTSDGSLEKISQVNSEMNIGSICISTDKKYLYAVDEIKNFDGIAGKGGTVCAYLINQNNGDLIFLNKQPSMGAFPCYITIDPKGKFIILTNHGSYDCISNTIINSKGDYEVVTSYDDGSVALFPVKNDGTIKPLSYLDIQKGRGPHPFFQQSSHPHAVNISPNNQFAVVCNKGNDQITVYKIDHLQSKLKPNKPFKTKIGTGPRHAVFHPTLPYLFIINEVVSTVSSFHFNNITGELIEIETQQTIPPEFTATNYPADIRIHPNGMFLYGSNRGHNSIFSFKIEQQTGKLTSFTIIQTNGENPREFNLTPSGEYLLVGNLDSNNIVSFSVDKKNGQLTQLSLIDNIQKPVCIQFLEF